MQASDVICHLVHNNSNAFFLSLISQFLVLLIRPIARIDIVQIRHRIPVVAVGLHVILKYRIQPQARNAHLLEIIQALNDPRQITSVSSTDKFTVWTLQHSFYLVIGRIAISETIWSNQVNEIRRAESLAFCRAFLALQHLNGQGSFLTALLVFKEQLVCSNAGIIWNDDLHKQIVWAFQCRGTNDH